MGAAEVLGLDKLSKLRRKADAIRTTIAKLEAEGPQLVERMATAKAKAVSLLEANPDRAVNVNLSGIAAEQLAHGEALECARAAAQKIGADLAAAEAEDRQRRAAESLAAREVAIRQAHGDAVAAFAMLARAVSMGYAAVGGIGRVHALAYPGDTSRTLARFDPRDAAQEVEDRLRASSPDVAVSGGFERHVYTDDVSIPYAAPGAFDEALGDDSTPIQ